MDNTFTNSKKFGYIYVRTNKLWEQYNACKLGKTACIPEREITYITGELIHGQFIFVVELDISYMDIVEFYLQQKFIKWNITKFEGAGTEFYDKEILNRIIPELDKRKIKYRQLSIEEINQLTRINRKYSSVCEDDIPPNISPLTCSPISTRSNSPFSIKTASSSITSGSIDEETEYIPEHSTKYVFQNEIPIRKNRSSTMFTAICPRTYQTEIINETLEYFAEKNNKGLLIIPCGVGKTYISLFISYKLQNNTILIGVPNHLLLTQWEYASTNIFTNYPILIVKSGVHSSQIASFLTQNNKCIVITTYASSYKVRMATIDVGFLFDMKILDEAHHLTSYNININNYTANYIEILHINCKNQLALTATIKELEYDAMNTEKVNMVSNDSVEYFGNIIVRKCLLWAIEKGIVCDYDIQTIITNDQQLTNEINNMQYDQMNDDDKRLFLSAFACLKSIHEGHTTHALIYCNKMENTEKICEYIYKLLDSQYFIFGCNNSQLFYSNYNSNMSNKKQNEIIHNFGNTTFGIIACVYCLGEGWDFPKLDSVVFAENMSSNIRIVQSALRASRKTQDFPNKKAKIILPILNKNNWLDNTENNDYKKIREVVYQMAIEDETIAQKIRVFHISIEKQKEYVPTVPTSFEKKNEYVGAFDAELTQSLILKIVKRQALGITYEKARKILCEKRIRSKEEYLKLCEKDWRLSPDPDIVFKGQFQNWLHYLCIDCTHFYDLPTCKEKIQNYLKLNPEIKQEQNDLSKICIELCKLDNKFPPAGLWVNFYNVNELNQLIYLSYGRKKINI